jgi:hypothetical protein
VSNETPVEQWNTSAGGWAHWAAAYLAPRQRGCLISPTSNRAAASWMSAAGLGNKPSSPRACSQLLSVSLPISSQFSASVGIRSSVVRRSFIGLCSDGAARTVEHFFWTACGIFARILRSRHCADSAVTPIPFFVVVYRVLPPQRETASVGRRAKSSYAGVVCSGIRNLELWDSNMDSVPVATCWRQPLSEEFFRPLLLQTRPGQRDSSATTTGSRRYRSGAAVHTGA